MSERSDNFTTGSDNFLTEPYTFTLKRPGVSELNSRGLLPPRMYLPIALDVACVIGAVVLGVASLPNPIAIVVACAISVTVPGAALFYYVRENTRTYQAPQRPPQA